MLLAVKPKCKFSGFQTGNVNDLTLSKLARGRHLPYVNKILNKLAELCSFAIIVYLYIHVYEIRSKKHHIYSISAFTECMKVFTAQCTLAQMRGIGIACRPSVCPSVRL